MRRTVAFTIVVFVSAVLMVGAMVWAQGEVVQQFDQGSINWSTGKVVAVGIGAPPSKPANMAQARAMARRAAITVARRNLLEISQGVQVDSMTLVKDFTVRSDIIRSSVQGVVRNAQVIDTAYMSDGSVEVTMVMSLGGEFANVILPPPPVGTVFPLPPPGTEMPASQVYTGMVIDARGLGARPAMAPKIVDESGKEIYGSAMVNREFAVQQGMVGYAKDLSAAQVNSRVTDRPVTIKALRTSGAAKVDVVISDSDAAKLTSAAENLSFLQKCRVMVVLD
ncbi:MAG: LPP20 family lipoprotein [Deltaproteobacteria bacterium]|nr:LPP20 family lipoprotein [Deltaproteobacteria bacterium]